MECSRLVKADVRAARASFFSRRETYLERSVFTLENLCIDGYVTVYTMYRNTVSMNSMFTYCSIQNIYVLVTKFGHVALY